MFTMDEMLSKRNRQAALAHFRTKKNGRGADGMTTFEFEEYWEMNHERIEEELRTCTYVSDIVKTTEIVNGKGKRRIISNLSMVDRFISRLLSQKLKRYLEPIF